MRVHEILAEARVGREFQHVEDLVYIDGVDGVNHILERLQDIEQRPEHLEVKWDGSPAIIFGRDQQGQFHFADKFAREPITSSQDLYKMYMSRAREADEARQRFASSMAGLYDLYQQATPVGFRGYVEAALLYQDTPKKNRRGEYEFMPNTVRYMVDADSDLGRRIGASKTGATITAYMSEFGGQRQPPREVWQQLGSQDVVIVPPKYTTEQKVKLDQQHIRAIKNLAQKHGAAIEAFIAPEAGLSDIRNIIYSYVNARHEQLDSEDFDSWLSTSPVSASKQQRLRQRLESNRTGLDAIFEIMRHVVVLKLSVIQQLETPALGAMGMRAELATGAPGGEGLVSDPEELGRPLKLVSRAGFTAANIARRKN
jgi:hypothetical protein